MKKRIIFLLATLLCTVLFAACSITTGKSVTYAVSTGDNVEVSLTSGYDITTDVPFTISKDDQAVFQGMFTYDGTLAAYRDGIVEAESAELIEEGEKDGNAYIFYCVKNEYGNEYNYIVHVADSDTEVILASFELGEETARAAFEATTVSSAN